MTIEDVAANIATIMDETDYTVPRDARSGGWKSLPGSASGTRRTAAERCAQSSAIHRAICQSAVTTGLSWPSPSTETA
jgi:hypothetical protein